MAAVIKDALNVDGSTSSFLRSSRNLKRRSTQARDVRRVVSFDELITPHVQKIFRVTYRITRNREDAEDAIQDACLQAFAHFADFDGRSTFATWLTSIAINAALMILRKRKTGRFVSLDGAASGALETETFPQLRDRALNAEQRYFQKEREATVRDAIQKLRPSLKGVVEVSQLGERSIRETAEIVGISVGAAKARLFHARAVLRKSVKLRRLRDAGERAGKNEGKA